MLFRSRRNSTRSTETRPTISEIQLWDVATWQVRSVLTGHTCDGVKSVAFTADGETLVSTDGCDVRVWDVRTAKERAVLKDPDHEMDIFALSPDGKKLATACQEFSYQDGTVRIWDMAKLTAQKLNK